MTDWHTASGVSLGTKLWPMSLIGPPWQFASPFLFGGSGQAQNKPDTVGDFIISHATGNYEEGVPGHRYEARRWAHMGHYVDADRCAKNGPTAFLTSNTLQRSASELTPGTRVFGVMLTGDMLKPIPWAYQVFIH